MTTGRWITRVVLIINKLQSLIEWNIKCSIEHLFHCKIEHQQIQGSIRVIGHMMDKGNFDQFIRLVMHMIHFQQINMKRNFEWGWISEYFFIRVAWHIIEIRVEWIHFQGKFFYVVKVLQIASVQFYKLGKPVARIQLGIIR